MLNRYRRWLNHCWQVNRVWRCLKGNEANDAIDFDENLRYIDTTRTRDCQIFEPVQPYLFNSVFFFTTCEDNDWPAEVSEKRFKTSRALVLLSSRSSPEILNLLLLQAFPFFHPSRIFWKYLRNCKKSLVFWNEKVLTVMLEHILFSSDVDSCMRAAHNYIECSAFYRWRLLTMNSFRWWFRRPAMSTRHWLVPTQNCEPWKTVGRVYQIVIVRYHLRLHGQQIALLPRRSNRNRDYIHKACQEQESSLCSSSRHREQHLGPFSTRHFIPRTFCQKRFIWFSCTHVKIL